MSVDVSVGDAHLELPSKTYSFWGWTDSATNVVVTTADATNGRVDSLVAWLDTTVVTTASNNSPGSFKFSIIAGTPAGSPVAKSDTEVQAALGSTIAWTRLAYVYVGPAVTSITNAVITDARTPLVLRNTAVGASSITASKIDLTTFGNLPTIPTKTATISIGYGITVNFLRFGNIVTAQANTTTAVTIPQSDSASLSETIPSGYRPLVGQPGIMLVLVVVGTSGSRMSWQVASDGAMSFSNTTATSGTIRLGITGSWITNDSFPV